MFNCYVAIVINVTVRYSWIEHCSKVVALNKPTIMKNYGIDKMTSTFKLLCIN